MAKRHKVMNENGIMDEDKMFNENWIEGIREWKSHSQASGTTCRTGLVSPSDSASVMPSNAMAIIVAEGKAMAKWH
ncbi:hypothetical protein VKT23_020577 [Stygiomarasmius scandens]|uniref:Uncharacterized protein n=1 Tax=Marasmiellus scandens TaxID=2682957 RepID=A0ABR1IIQ7_9AGAR